MRRVITLVGVLCGCAGSRRVAPAAQDAGTRTPIAVLGDAGVAQDAGVVPREDVVVQVVARPPGPAVCHTTGSAVLGAECVFAGASCAGHGAPVEFPVALRGTTVTAGAAHGGCNITQYALVYEAHTSPLRLRVCGTAPAPMDCPAVVDDRARWDIAALLRENGAVHAVLVEPQGRR